MLQKERSTTTHKCPKCGTDQVRRVRRFTGLDRVFSLVNAYPYLCLDCPFEIRFHRFGRS
jgi:predicted RNA-binding Zn-ribbon protein involved in translation (DUF1610 family)